MKQDFHFFPLKHDEKQKKRKNHSIKMEKRCMQFLKKFWQFTYIQTSADRVKNAGKQYHGILNRSFRTWEKNIHAHAWMSTMAAILFWRKFRIGKMNVKNSCSYVQESVLADLYSYSKLLTIVNFLLFSYNQRIYERHFEDDHHEKMFFLASKFIKHSWTGLSRNSSTSYFDTFFQYTDLGC